MALNPKPRTPCLSLLALQGPFCSAKELWKLQKACTPKGTYKGTLKMQPLKEPSKGAL